MLCKDSSARLAKTAQQTKKNQWVSLYLCQAGERKNLQKRPLPKKRLPIGKKSDILYIVQYLLF